MAAVAVELGIERGLLDWWRRETNQAETGSRKAIVGQGNPRAEELAQLCRENANLRKTKEILKISRAHRCAAHFHPKGSPVMAYLFMEKEP